MKMKWLTTDWRNGGIGSETIIELGLCDDGTVVWRKIKHHYEMKCSKCKTRCFNGKHCKKCGTKLTRNEFKGGYHE